jgi:hypothetical protein
MYLMLHFFNPGQWARQSSPRGNAATLHVSRSALGRDRWCQAVEWDLESASAT